MTVNYTEIKILEQILKTHYPTKDLFDKKDILFILNEFNKADEYLYKQQKKPTPYKTFKYFVRYCLYRNLANFDSLVLLTADKGEGKSSFALMLVREWCKLLGLPMKLNAYFAYTNKQVVERIDKLDRFSPLVADESANFAMAENWAKLENKTLKQKLAKVRTRHLFFILCFPLKVYKLDKTYLDSYVNYWISIFNRGEGALFVKDRNPVNESWRLKDFTELGAYNEFTETEFVEKKLKKHPNFWMMIKAPKPSEKLYNKYLVIREHNIYHSAEEAAVITKQDIYRALLIRTLKDVLMGEDKFGTQKIMSHVRINYGIPMSPKAVKDIIQESIDIVEKVNIEEAKDERKIKAAETLMENVRRSKQ